MTPPPPPRETRELESDLTTGLGDARPSSFRFAKDIFY